MVADTFEIHRLLVRVRTHAFTIAIKIMQSNKICFIFCLSCIYAHTHSKKYNRNPNNKKIQLVAIRNGACFRCLFCHFIDRNRKKKAICRLHMDECRMHLQAEVSLCVVRCATDNLRFLFQTKSSLITCFPVSNSSIPFNLYTLQYITSNKY